MSYNEAISLYFSAMMAAGVPYSDADSIRRDAERIDTWNALECGTGSDAIEWAEDGGKDHRGKPLKAGKPYRRTGLDNPHAPVGGYWWPTADRYTPAIARVDAFAKKYGFNVRHNSDPRGWPVHFTTRDGREIAPPIRPNK